MLRATERSLVSGAASILIRKNTERLARTFIAGASSADGLSSLKRLHREGFAFTADLLGESTVSDAEGVGYQARYTELIRLLAAETSTWPNDEVIDQNHLGPIPRANVSLKLSALDPHIDPVDPEGSVERLLKRALPILLEAKERGVFVNLDLEQWELHGITYDVLEALVQHPELRMWPHVGIVVQAYLRCAQNDMERVLSIARARGAPLTVRLVKGAYWDFEVVRSRRHGFECPVYTDKGTTDAQFERLSRFLFEHVDYLLPALASHNLRSLTHAVAVADECGLPATAYEIQMLYGMAEPERVALRRRGHRVRVYAPLGELLPGIAYLIRRLLENTSNEGFLRQGFRDEADLDSLLAKPQATEEATPDTAPSRHGLDAAFENCPPTDFTDEVQRVTFSMAVARVQRRLPFEVPLCVGGRRCATEPVIDRWCPSETQRLVARISMASVQDAEKAVTTAEGAWPGWRDRAVRERAELLETLADRLEKDRYDLAALQIFEEGKPWREADGDVTEAIDFCRYYARRALVELSSRVQDVRPGESNELLYEGRGVAVVIAPWNFPMAILCGMAAATLVAGNTVIIKPSGNSSAAAFALYERMIETGFPADVVQLVPGRGSDVGSRLVDHPSVATIAFTGSMEVGLEILRKAGQIGEDQLQLKRVVCEMGGKNAIIVDDDADLDEAVAGVVESAFGYAGQKCSACSRCIVVGRHVYEAFAKRLVEACRSITIAAAHDPSCELGPVIDEAALARLRAIIEKPGAGASPLYLGSAPDGGHFLGPAVFEVRDEQHELMQQELFGPILALMQVEDFEAALDVATSTRFALTGGVYSRHPGHVEQARRRFRVGNLYINRTCTGALVHRQPFGGFGMSGSGTKAGGPSYLLHFADPRAVAENTVRHGFAPEVSSKRLDCGNRPSS